MIDEAGSLDSLTGYLKILGNNKYFVKHKDTYVYVPLEISAWETNLTEVYENRIDQLVNFKLTKFTKINKLSAELTDAQFTKEYYELQAAVKESRIFKATITGKNPDGLFATVMKGRVAGFIPITKKSNEHDLVMHKNLTNGDKLDVAIKHIYNNKKVHFRFNGCEYEMKK